MTEKPKPGQSHEWRPGARVSRINPSEVGTVVAADGVLKVKSDDGRTSYFHRERPANLRMADKAS